MAIVDKNDLESALEWVSSTIMINEAFICRETGKIYWVGDDAGAVDEEDIPEDLDDFKKYEPVPDKRDIDLGTSLVFDYVAHKLPEHYDRVKLMFRRKGAYGRFREFLDGRDLLDDWHAHSNARTTEKLANWCSANGFKLQ